MMVDFGSCIHEPPRWREPASIERLAAAEQAPGLGIPLADGRAVALGGAAWLVQSSNRPTLSLMAPRQELVFAAAAGERAGFDGLNKVRVELCGADRYEKGEPIRFAATLRIDANSRLGNADWCIIAQIHQADTRRADGSFVQGSPLFALALALGPDGKPRLRVTGETGTGTPAPGVFSKTRSLGETPFSFGVDHRIAFTVVDGHGGPGSIRVSLDGAAIVDQTGIATGYAYVDELAAATNPPQGRGSYLKFGVYAGRFDGDRPPDGFRLTARFRGIEAKPHAPR